ncbi:membrane protein [Sphingomonas metalli]|uniref:Membrane protein n=1 Tax=Sphingomonas metalli TaxID=1779358 RepID=A0A916WPL5_9SPHN|nr:MAPEG family protein [Sphingomonas metalli]GGB18401.1 membrane protein [Sphingomonas metalli]
MIAFHILWPVFGFVALVFTVAILTVRERVAFMKRQPPRREDFTTSAAATRYFEGAGRAADNLRNLFEMPVLFLVLVPLLTGTRQAGIAQVLLAWIFVALRVLHSQAHIAGAVRLRFRLFLASNAVLAAMWIGFLIDFSIAAVHYASVMDRLAQP